MKLASTKGQRTILRNRSGIGMGIVIWKSGEMETSEIEFYTARDETLRRVGDRGLLLPFLQHALTGTARLEDQEQPVPQPSFFCPSTAYTIGDVLHHPTGQGNVWMLLIADILYQSNPPHTPLSLYQLQTDEQHRLPCDQIWYHMVVLRDTITPEWEGKKTVSLDALVDVDPSPNPECPWIKIGHRPDWVPFLHMSQLNEGSKGVYDLSELIEAQDRLMNGTNDKRER